MDLAAWKAAWGIFMNDPIPFGAAVIVLMGIAWWLRGFIAQERIAVLEERLRLAADEQKRVTDEVEKLKKEISELNKQIEGKLPLAALAVTTATVNGTIGDLELANTTLGTTLSVLPGKYRPAMPEPEKISVTRRSDDYRVR